MGGAALYIWLTLLCLLSVAVLFGMGWGLSVWGRRQERLARQRRREARAAAREHAGPDATADVSEGDLP